MMKLLATFSKLNQLIVVVPECTCAAHWLFLWAVTLILGMSMGGCVMSKPKEKIRLVNVSKVRLIGKKDEFGVTDILFGGMTSISGVNDIAFSLNSKLVAVGADNLFVGTGNKSFLKLYDADTLSLIKKIETDYNSRIAFNANGDMLASMGFNRIALWDTKSLEKITTSFMDAEQYEGTISPLFNPVGDLLACSGEDGVVELWDLRNEQRVFKMKLERHYRGSGVPLAFSPDGRILAMGYPVPGGETEKGEVLLWDVKTGKELARWREDIGSVRDIAFSPKGDILAVADYTGPTGISYEEFGWDWDKQVVHRIGLWNVKEGRLIATLKGHQRLDYIIELFVILNSEGGGVKSSIYIFRLIATECRLESGCYG